MQCLGKVPPFLVNKVPVVVVLNSMIPHSGLLKTLEIRTSDIEDIKSGCPITTACQLFVLAVSTLLVKCLFATCKVFIIAVCFPDNLSKNPYHCAPNKRPRSSRQTSLVTATYQRARFGSSLVTCFHTGRPHLHTYICPLQ